MITVNGIYDNQTGGSFSKNPWMFGANGIGMDVSRTTGSVTVNELAQSRVRVEDISASSGGTFQPLEVCIDGETSTIYVLVQS